jgi:signal transduction histidine kinase
VAGAATRPRGSLILSSDRDHLKDGVFDPRALVVGLRGLIDQSVRDGFQGLCASGDMRWELGEDKNFDRLQEYESLLEQVFHEKPLRGVCQYHRGTVPSRAIQAALLTHRSVYVGTLLNQDNLFYVPPDLLLEGTDAAARDKQGEWMCQQITRTLKAERRRDEALLALSASEGEQRRLADALTLSNDDLERRVAARTMDLEAANRELESFSYSVSHDLRAPLRSINGFIQAILDDEADRLTADGKDCLDRACAASRRMSELIDDMLDLSRITRRTIVPEAVDLAAIAKEVAAELDRTKPPRPVAFDVAEGMTVYGDAVLLRAVLENLLGNAWKFTGKTPSPRVSFGVVADPAGGRTFHVRDNGAGFDMAYAGKLFGAFQRLHGMDEFPGTGVGLATVKRIIAKHGGRIWAESVGGKGATFYFTLPEFPPAPADRSKPEGM